MPFNPFLAILSLLAVSVVAHPYSDSPPAYSRPGPNTECSSGNFYYEPKRVCLPRGGSSPHPPPLGKSCPPASHYWSKDFSCCLPRHPVPKHAPPPQCSDDHEWNYATQCCEPPVKPTKTHPVPKPSQTPGYKHHGGDHDRDHDHDEDQDHDRDEGQDHDRDEGQDHDHDKDHDHDNNHGSSGYVPPKYPVPARPGSHYKKRSATPLCPRSLEACPISGLTVNTRSGDEYECLDTAVELTSCGGCTSTGKGQDCTAIRGAWNVGCEQGSCAVYTCALGFRVAEDGKSCSKV